MAQANADIQAALDLQSDPADLNLLEALEGLESDSANLLMFSAAFLKAGISDSGLNALTDDFADDGEFNGDGIDELQSIESEANNALLSDARMRLQNQYGGTPPDGSSGDFSWELSQCAVLALTEPVFSAVSRNLSARREMMMGNRFSTCLEGTGFYSFSLSGSELKSFAGWTLDDASGTEQGSATSDDGNTTTFALDDNEQYSFDLFLAGLSNPSDGFTLHATRVLRVMRLTRW
ncbi:hypothetical protein CF392_16360 [Tamilnaduibacter salinus]|uniref:Uncharacterized protein n=1 Tax=Tamilnaduibacter salinus TaxID=1484056 RepID=A0A2A2HZK3_9GAMM|nr:hypothetical protein [Tamilnaduibacter salinus]PAV24424.1 hypothetical protein CF392_16360 [Tamilnaduibacter salinus]